MSHLVTLGNLNSILLYPLNLAQATPDTFQSTMGGGGGTIPQVLVGDAPVGLDGSQSIGSQALLGDFVLLTVSLVLLSASIFLLFQASAFQTWASRGDEHAPQANAGIGFALTVSVLVLLLWTGFLFFNFADPYDLTPLNNWLVRMLLKQPALFAPAALIASMVPSLLALFKFTVANSLVRARISEESVYVRKPLVALVGAVYTLLQLAAAIVTLVVFLTR